MTDELMDARLREAGDRWRAANTTPADVRAEPRAPTIRRRRPWTLIVSAAAVAAVLVAGLVTALVLVGGGKDTTTRPGRAPLAGTVWRLAGYGGDRDEQFYSTLRIAQGRLVADDLCSVSTATASVDGNTITFAALDTRYRSCTDTVGEGPQFTDGLALFRGATRWAIDGTRLTLTRGSTVAHFVASDLAAPSTDVPTVTSANWQLASAYDARGTQHLVDSDANARLRIERGRFTAGDTCNTLVGRASATPRQVVLSDVSTTEIGCSGESAATASIVDRVLSGTVQAETDNITLTITKKGIGKLAYVWVPSDSAATDTGALTGRTWHLATVAGARTGIDATLRIDGSTLKGEDGCRPYSGIARVTPGVMTLTGPSTNPPESCPPDTTTLDSFLTQPDVLWRVQDGKLVVLGGGAQAFALVFTTTTPRPARDALDGRWALTSIIRGATAQSVPQNASLTVVAGAVTVEAACVKKRGSATESMVVISEPNEAHDMCLSSLEKVLAGTFRWVITDGQLRLTNDAQTLIFERMK